MAELLINSVPSGADVIIDGEIVGTTPLVLPTEISLEAFRAECLTAEAVSCDWNTLQARLNNHDVSRLWWFLTEPERRSIAEEAIKNTLFYRLLYGRSGKLNCDGGEGEVSEIVCIQNAMVRYLKFGSSSSTIGDDSCYYRKTTTSEEYCYVPDISYNLPCHIVSCATHGVGFAHIMCGIQVVNNTDSIDNWIIFQYSDLDIKPGHWQIPTDRYDLYIRFSSLQKIYDCINYTITEIARFEL